MECDQGCQLRCLDSLKAGAKTLKTFDIHSFLLFGFKHYKKIEISVNMNIHNNPCWSSLLTNNTGLNGFLTFPTSVLENKNISIFKHCTTLKIANKSVVYRELKENLFFL